MLANSPSPDDLLQVRGAEAYLYFPAGSARSKLTNAWLDRQLQTTTTWRKLLTVRQLVEMAAE